MIGENSRQKIRSQAKTNLFASLWPKISSSPQLRLSFYLKEFSAVFMSFSEFAPFLGEGTKSAIVLTDNRSIKWFVHTKAFPSSLWNACYYVKHIILKLEHKTVSINTAVDIICRPELKITENIHLKIQKDIMTTPIEVTTPSSDISDEKQIFFTQADIGSQTGEQILGRKKIILEKCSRMGSERETIKKTK